MQKKLTFTLDKRVYEGQRTVVGRRRISQFIESLVRPYVIGQNLEVAYQLMARDEAREPEALEWTESTLGDVAHDRVYPSEAFVTVRGKKHKAMADQLTTVSKARLHNRLGRLSKAAMLAIEQAIKVQLELT